MLFADLRDLAFGAPGIWSLYRCLHCRAGYLDPRPSAATLPLAYRSYFTHAPTHEAIDVLPADAREARRRMSRNWYLNRRWKTKLPVGSTWRGALYALTRQIWRRRCGRIMRELPRPARGQLLDVGCGNGEFLMLARQCGWKVLGVDFDPEAAQTARARGVEVLVGGIEALEDRGAEFDAITLSHVIEHVPQPGRVLRRCRELLKPGGYCWIETPNLDSTGARWLGECWRGLEPPRHLVLFNAFNLRQQLAAAGFVQIRQQPWVPTLRGLYQESRALREPGYRLAWYERMLCRWIERYQRLFPSEREFLTFTARAPAAGFVATSVAISTP